MNDQPPSSFPPSPAPYGDQPPSPLAFPPASSPSYAQPPYPGQPVSPQATYQAQPPVPPPARPANQVGTLMRRPVTLPLWSLVLFACLGLGLLSNVVNRSEASGGSASQSTGGQSTTDSAATRAPTFTVAPTVTVTSAATAPPAATKPPAVSAPPTATVPPPATKPPAPTAAPTHVPTWTVVQTFQGNGSKKTSIFTMPDQWRIVWSCNPSSSYTGQYNLIVDVNASDGTPIDLGAINTICQTGNTHDQTDEYQGGDVYLDVNSEAAWTLQIEVLQ